MMVDNAAADAVPEEHVVECVCELLKTVGGIIRLDATNIANAIDATNDASSRCQ
jgi:hypothetical protein